VVRLRIGHITLIFIIKSNDWVFLSAVIVSWLNTCTGMLQEVRLDLLMTCLGSSETIL